MMCEPATIIAGVSAVIAAAGTAASVSTASGQAKAQQRQQQNQRMATEYQRQQNEVNARAALVDETTQQNNQLLQADVQDAQKVDASRIRQMQASSALQNSVASAGVGGISIDALQADYDAQLGVFERVQGYNAELRRIQADQNNKSSSTRFSNRVNSLQPYLEAPVVNQTLGVALSGLSQVGEAGAAFANEYKAYRLTKDT